MHQELKPTLSENKIQLIVYVILLLYPLVGMGIDLIAPSLPAISRDLAASKMFSKNLITIYLLGYALGSFIIGFLSDALGRRQLLLLGLGAFVLVSLLPIFLPHVSTLLIARFLQGITLGFFSVLGRAVLADLLSQEQLIRIAVVVAMMWGIGPIIGPVIGGYLQFYFNWQASFYFFALVGFIGFIISFVLIPETHFNRQPLNISRIKKNLFTIMSHRLFMGIVLLMGLTYSLLIVFNTLGPFLIQTELNHTSIYFGHLALLMGCIYLATTTVCRYLVKIHRPHIIIFYSVIIFLLIMILLTILAYYQNQNIWVISLATACMFIECGFVYSTGMGISISLFRDIAGSSIAMMILINVLLTSLISFVMSLIHVSNGFELCLIYFALMILSAVIFFGMVYIPSILKRY